MPAWKILICLVGAAVSGMVSLVSAGPYTDSAHGNRISGVDRSSIDAKYSAFAKGNCSHCHELHSSLGGIEPEPSGSVGNRSLRFAAEEDLCNTCHDGNPVAPNIQIEFNKLYSHPVTSYRDRHTLGIAEKGQGGQPFRGIKRHVECSDCHEPHTVQGQTHSAPGNAVSGVLLGSWGVEPNTESLWQPPISSTEVAPATKEYQICFKCHSYYALQDLDGVTSLLGPSGVPITDQAMEFSKANRSVHPVRVALNAQTGSYSPNALGNSKMKAPWNLSSGNQTMYCSDCHGNNTATPVGPHGSNNPFMLEGNWSWPFKPGGGKLWTLADVKNNQNSWNTRLLCAKCHTMIVNNNFNNQPHNKSDHISGGYNAAPYSNYDTSLACVACHTPVPHGSSASRLIGYDTLPEPYKVTVATGATFPVIRQFKKASSATNYNKQSCFVPTQAACHAVHDKAVEGAD